MSRDSTMTVKLYYEDAYLTEFEARVVRRLELDGRPAVVLDRTAFYPTGGGQPHDTGWLNDVPVLDVLLDETSGEVLHLLAGPLTEEHVTGRLNWERRHDHMQQHTGQHILSEAFMRVNRAQTVSFHLGEDASTIDLDRAPIPAEELRAAEDLANRIVFEDRPVTARFLTPAEAAQVPFRKPPAVSENIRLVEVAGFDWSACGGTHCRSTGEVGLIHIAGVERRGAETRVTFLCGRRALQDYRRKEGVLQEVCAFLTTGWQVLPEIVRKMDEERRAAQRQLQKAREELAGLEALALLAGAEQVGTWRVVRKVFADREPAAVKQLAGRLLEHAGVVVLLGWQGPDKGQLFLGRSADVPADMQALLRQVCGKVGGGGGGRPDFAQGGGMPADRVAEALELAMTFLAGGEGSSL